ncbi:hypothetical protein GCM10011518_37060 [Flavobacterium limi]|uniref:Uncharacterized protein n=1 Tax=Flavobacterium limi TaxID=2045105 RepID=A0ABQ1URD4_9FLAO|nr:hypothetical protein GCM10011518_37060 [Flavobacterium limi]
MFLGVGKCNGDGFLDCADKFSEVIVTKIVITVSDFVKYLNDNLFIMKCLCVTLGRNYFNA